MRAMMVLSVVGIFLFAGMLPSVLAQNRLGSSSGFLVDPRGYILTAEHVVDEAGSKKIEVIVGGQHRYLADVVETDKDNDLALLKIEGKDLPTVKLGRADAAKRQEAVWVIGYPLGYQEITRPRGKSPPFGPIPNKSMTIWTWTGSLKPMRG